jgi:ferric-dicitrate binding protein FerR (iron transport regulator)
MKVRSPGLALGWLSVLLLLLPVALFGQGRISYALGEVDLLRDGGAIIAGIGEELEPGDRVRTGSDGTAVIELDNGTHLKLRENTLLNLNRLEGNVEVELREGSLFSRVERAAGRGYRVRNGPVVAGVRGTEFFVAYGRTVE